MPKRIALIGTGGMATVCALQLHRLGHVVGMLARDAQRAEAIVNAGENKKYLPGHPLPSDLLVTAEADLLVGKADVLVNCIPTQHIRSVWGTLLDVVPGGVPVASVAKGIERKSLLRPTQILADTLGEVVDGVEAKRAWATLSGPTIAEELADRLPASVVAAASEPSFGQMLQDLFNDEHFRVYTNEDLLGVELAGAVKNVIAIGAGIVDGLGGGMNAKSALLARGLAEITRLGLAMGARPETFSGVAGVGDLATTCFSPLGRNRSFGERLGQGESVEEALAHSKGVVEGVPSTEAVLGLAAKHGVEIPITEVLGLVLFEGLSPTEGIERLMGREPTSE